MVLRFQIIALEKNKKSKVTDFLKQVHSSETTTPIITRFEVDMKLWNIATNLLHSIYVRGGHLSRPFLFVSVNYNYLKCREWIHVKMELKRLHNISFHI